MTASDIPEVTAIENESFYTPWSSNTAAIRLYKSIGFRMLGLKRGYYFLPGEDAVIMGLQLP